VNFYSAIAITKPPTC